MNKDLQLVLEHLMYEGYADNYNSAAKIINSMSDEWLFGILNEVQEFRPIYIREGGRTTRRGREYIEQSSGLPNPTQRPRKPGEKPPIDPALVAAQQPNVEARARQFRGVLDPFAPTAEELARLKRNRRIGIESGRREKELKFEIRQ